MKKRIIIHPFLFAAFPIIHLAAFNLDQCALSEIWPALFGVLLATLAIYAIWKLIYKNWDKAAIVTSVTALVFFSYGQIQASMKDFSLGWGIGPNKILYPLALAFLFGILIYVNKSKPKVCRYATPILNLISLLLVLYSAVSIIVYQFQVRRVSHNVRSQKRINIAQEARQSGVMPDIYYIIPDRYASQRSLMRFYNYNNSEFIEYLKCRGFYLPTRSYSNYPKTAFSLASSLNMEHLVELGEEIGEDLQDWYPLYSIMENYKVWHMLKNMGYTFIHIGSPWWVLQKNQYADYNFYYMTQSEFVTVLYQNTMLYPITEKMGISWGLDRKGRRMQTLYQLDKLIEVAGMKGPKYVFAHILCPHPPFVFKRDGTYLTEEESEIRTERDNYVEAVLFINAKLKIVIDEILSRSALPPIIILQSDEGPFFPRLAQNERGFDWRQASIDELEKKFGILSAYYLPGLTKGILYPSITPVNTFRVIFNHYFGSDMKLLADENYVFKDHYHRYKFIPVTSKLGL